MQKEDAGADAVVGDDGGAVERSSLGRLALSAQGFLAPGAELQHR